MRLAFAILAGWLVLAGPTARGAPPAALVSADAIQPHVALDGDGSAYVVFLHKGNVAVAVSADQGKSFSAPVVAIDAQGRARGGHKRGPRIGVDAKKNLTVTCPLTFDDAENEQKYPTAELYLVTSADGGKTWSKPAQVNEVSRKAPEALHWMAVAPNGEVHVAWLDRRDREGPGQDLYYAKVVNGKVDRNVKLGTTVCECCAPGLAVDADGNPFVAWREGGKKSSREIFAVRSTDRGASFGKPVQVNRVPTKEESCPMSAPAVAVSADGKTFFVAWKDVRAGEPNVYWTTAVEPNFSKEVLLHEDTRGEQNYPTLTVEPSGTAWAAWVDKRPGRQGVWARSSAENDKGQEVSEAADGAADFPVVASGGGLVGVVYEAKKDGKNGVLFRVLKQAAAKGP